MATERPTQIGDFLRSRTGVALIVFLGIAAFFLITEHGAHLFGVLPFALLLLCPLMHLFMHGGHGGHGGDVSNHEGHPTAPEERSR
jgi:hypothetical protein